MPCSSGQYDNYHDTSTEDALRAEVKTLSGYLCDVCTVLDVFTIDIPEPIATWWNKHTAAEHDKVKREALAKLTPRELRVLGLV